MIRIRTYVLYHMVLKRLSDCNTEKLKFYNPVTGKSNVAMTLTSDNPRPAATGRFYQQQAHPNFRDTKIQEKLNISELMAYRSCHKQLCMSRGFGASYPFNK